MDVGNSTTINFRDHAKINKDERSANDNLLVVPKTQLNYGDITFTVAAAKMWNKLPAVIKLSGNVDIFKKHLKTHLFTQTMD